MGTEAVQAVLGHELIPNVLFGSYYQKHIKIPRIALMSNVQFQFPHLHFCHSQRDTSEGQMTSHPAPLKRGHSSSKRGEKIVKKLSPHQTSKGVQNAKETHL